MLANGVLVGGKRVIIPGVIPEVDASALTPVSPGLGRVPLVIGAADGGDPSQVYSFGSFQDALAVLRGGPVLSYIARVFNPAPDAAGASQVLFIRASATALQGSYTLTSGGTLTMNFKSRGFGAWTNGITVALAQDAAGDATLPIDTLGGTYKGWTLTTSMAADRQSFTYRIKAGVLITAAANYTLNVDYTNQVIQVELSAAVVAETTFAKCPTLRDLVQFLNSLPGAPLTASFVGQGWYPTNTLNSGSHTLAATPIFVPAESALAAWLLTNLDPLVTATISTAAGALATLAQTNLTGGAGRGTDTIASGDLTPALTLASTVEAHAVFIQSATLALQQLALQHCISMSSVADQKWRVFFAGINFLGTSPVDGADATAATTDLAITAAVARSQALDGPAILAWNGNLYPNPLSGTSEQLGGLGVAAQAMGYWAGARKSVPLTNKTFTAQGLEFPKLTRTQMETLLDGGVFFLAYDTAQGRTKVIQAITTYSSTNPAFRNLQGLSITHEIDRMWLRVLANYPGGTLDLETGERIKADCAKALDAAILSGSNPDGFLTQGRLADGTILSAWDSLSVVGDSTTSSWTISVNAHAVGETDYIYVRTRLTPVPIEL